LCKRCSAWISNPKVNRGGLDTGGFSKCLAIQHGDQASLNDGTRKHPFPFRLFALQFGQIFSLFNLGLQYPQATHCQVYLLFIPSLK